MNSIGRNDPCPCGSGRKYRDCCSASDEAHAAALAYSNVRESTLAQLVAFSFQPAFDSDHTVAELVFWGNLVREASASELQWLVNSEDANIKYNCWFMFDWAVDEAGTVADLFLEENSGRLSAAERQFLERLAHAHLRLYEVEAVQPGRGVRLLDVWTGGRLFVVERGVTPQIVTWDLLGARVTPDGLGGNVFEGGLYIYPADRKAEIVGHFRRLHRRHHRKFPMDDLSTFFRKHGMVFQHLWLNLVAFPEPPTVLTSEGDQLIFCQCVFETPHADRVRALIASQPDICCVEEGRFSWREVLTEGEREVGTWALEGQRVVFETTSQERAARGRAWLERIAGDQVRYRATALEPLERTISELRRRRPRKSAAPPAPPEDEAVRDLLSHHYRIWLDRPEPALGNRSPRAAAATRIWRPRLVELLKQIENVSERGVLAGRPAYDFRWLWTELGLERP